MLQSACVLEVLEAFFKSLAAYTTGRKCEYPYSWCQLKCGIWCKMQSSNSGISSSQWMPGHRQMVLPAICELAPNFFDPFFDLVNDTLPCISSHSKQLLWCSSSQVNMVAMTFVVFMSHGIKVFWHWWVLDSWIDTLLTMKDDSYGSLAAVYTDAIDDVIRVTVCEPCNFEPCVDQPPHYTAFREVAILMIVRFVNPGFEEFHQANNKRFIKANMKWWSGKDKLKN